MNGMAFSVFLLRLLAEVAEGVKVAGFLGEIAMPSRTSAVVEERGKAGRGARVVVVGIKAVARPTCADRTRRTPSKMEKSCLMVALSLGGGETRLVLLYQRRRGGLRL